MYSLIAVFPVPHSKAPFAKLAHQLKQRLIYTNDILTSRWDDSSPLLLWMIFMGALASTAYNEDKDGCKEWYISVLNDSCIECKS